MVTISTKHLHQRLLRAGVALVLAATPAIILQSRAEAAGPTLQATLQSYANQLHGAGVSGVLVQMRDTDGSSVRARAGVTNRALGLPVSWGSHFRTGSTTKTFVSTVVLQLVAEGRLSLNDSVEHWLPGLFQGTGYNGSQITMRQLLSHTSGIFDYTSDEGFFATLDTPMHFNVNRFHTYTPKDLINIAKAHPPEFAPGTSWSYSNTNYIIVGEIIKKITGKTWDTEVKNRIINRLGLTETSSAGSNFLMPFPFANAYHIYTSDSAHREYTDTTFDNMTWGGAAGDIITTTQDENRFFRALMRGELLPPAQLAQMKTVVPVDETFSYGLGLLWVPSPCDPKGIWGHDGGTLGYATTNGVTDDGSRSIVVSMSTTSFTDEAFFENTIPLRTNIVNDALCYGKQNTSTRQKVTPSSPSSSPRWQVKF